ncbi:major cell surface glycoprotein (plasmid) [Haloarcula marismortui ATCC 43049]|uniref:Cell surface glycoprotein n=4 Tax=Haloarcula marismortui TaxID=2238 RepID=CSG_HALMA|nr:HVO_2072 family ArtA-dependent S-layer glycoprotein [Haloarcula marismortui]Q5V7F4.2 RecName: Full=Cell surface glycoprotein; AltName: Full=S-layer glycoprotein; Flags: Precursor [Haloarcula marismortui ATCC 43049]QCP89616.1 major cell surface glycoprotein [Haloarcula marismortui ATCC 43049]
MTNTKQKINAVFLSALMVMSVFAAAVAFSGAAAAANRGAGFTYSTGPTDSNGGGNGDSVGQVGPGAVVFQGEEDLEDGGNFGSNTDIGQLQKVSGDNSGILLGNPIPQDQPTGSYTFDGNSGTDGVTLQTPRVTSVEVQNGGSGDVTGSTLQTSSSGPDAFVRADYNFQEAEDLEITVEDENGLEVTNEIVVQKTGLPTADRNNDNGASGSNGDFDVGWELDTTDIDEGQYTITVEGTEDLTFGDASETVTVNITSDQQASLNLDNDEVVQGENLQFNVENSPEGNYHVVLVESSEFRDGITADQASRIFRNVGDVQEVGLVDNTGPVSASTVASNVGSDQEVADVTRYAYGVVEIDGGSGVGSIETQFLDDSSVDVELYPASDSSNDGYASGGSHASSVTVRDTDGDGTDDSEDAIVTDLLETDDDQSFDVVEGEITLDSPSGAYITGSQIDVNGTANQGVDQVALYARDNNDYELIEIDGSNTVSVDGDDTFSEEDVVLSQGSKGGNSIVSLPGSYRIGVIDVQDADLDSDGTVDDTLTTSDFNSGVSGATALRVTDTALNGTFTTYNGQIASDDGQIDVDGQAPGKDNVIVAFVDSRGNAAAQVVSVDDDDSFSEEDIDITSLSEGTVTAHILSSGRDGEYGDTGTSSDSAFVNTIETGYAGGSSTGDQVREQILANTVDDTASDDLIVNEQFRLTDGLTTIESVSSPVEANGTLEVQGNTNRVPDDNTITVEILNSEDESVTVESTDEWGSDGQWSVNVDLSDVDIEPGNYTVEADDGDNTDRTSVTVVEAGSLEEEQPDTETPEPDTETPEPDTETPEPDTETPEPDTETPEPDTETEEATTEASGPGFTAAIALIALVAAALLAVRRDN